MFAAWTNTALVCLQSESSFTDNQVLPTMLASTNLTIMTDEINGTEYITVDSFGAEATIVTPAAFACNVSVLACLLFSLAMAPRHCASNECVWHQITL